MWQQFILSQRPPIDVLSGSEQCVINVLQTRYVFSDFDYKFCFVVEEILKLGNTTKSQCPGVCIEVRGRQVNIDALIGNEHYPIRCLNQYIGQCVGH